MKIYKKEIIPGISEVNSNFNVKLSAIFGFFEQIAYEHARELKIGFRNTFPKKLIWVITQYDAHILHYPVLDQKCVVSTWIEPENGQKFSIRYYQLEDMNSKVLVKAATRWLLFNYQTKKVVDYRDEFSDFPSYDQQLTFPIIPTMHSQAETEFTQSLEVRGDDIDLNNHVNHRKYIDWMIPPHLTQDFEKSNETYLKFSFSGQTHPKDLLTILCKETRPIEESIENSTQINLNERIIYTFHQIDSEKAKKPVFTAQGRWSFRN